MVNFTQEKIRRLRDMQLSDKDTQAIAQAQLKGMTIDQQVKVLFVQFVSASSLDLYIDLSITLADFENALKSWLTDLVDNPQNVIDEHFDPFLEKFYAAVEEQYMVETLIQMGKLKNTLEYGGNYDVQFRSDIAELAGRLTTENFGPVSDIETLTVLRRRALQEILGPGFELYINDIKKHFENEGSFISNLLVFLCMMSVPIVAILFPNLNAGIFVLILIMYFSVLYFATYNMSPTIGKDSIEQSCIKAKEIILEKSAADLQKLHDEGDQNIKTEIENAIKAITTAPDSEDNTKESSTGTSANASSTPTPEKDPQRTIAIFTKSCQSLGKILPPDQMAKILRVTSTQQSSLQSASMHASQKTNIFETLIEKHERTLSNVSSLTSGSSSKKSF
jgi:uncharacterized membrane protein